MPEHIRPTDKSAANNLAAVTDLGDAGLATNAPDSITKSASDILEHERQCALVQAQWLKNKSDAEDIEARRKFADRIFRLTVRWLIFVGVVTVLSGEPFGCRVLTVDKSVMLALVGSVSVNVLGFFGGVIGYLFPKRK